MVWAISIPRTKLSYPEFVRLYQGNQGQFDKHWKVENGDFVNDGDGTYATTEKEYGDIELWIDYKTVALADSGIYLCHSPGSDLGLHKRREKVGPRCRQRVGRPLEKHARGPRGRIRWYSQTSLSANGTGSEFFKSATGRRSG